VAARHLHHFGYHPHVYYPKQPKNELYARLKTQLENLSVPFVDDFEASLKSADHVIDAIFGFSYNPPIRPPFPSIISLLTTTTIPVLSVDIPSSWDVENGPPSEGPGSDFMPNALISLTAPKPCVKYFKGRHFIGGRFLSKEMAGRYGVDVPEYRGDEQVIEVGIEGGGEGKL
jgi:NAD(P)H-hydrate epimerase